MIAPASSAPRTMKAACVELQTTLSKPVLKGDTEFLKELRDRCTSLVGNEDDSSMHLKAHRNPNAVWNDACREFMGEGGKNLPRDQKVQCSIDLESAVQAYAHNASLDLTKRQVLFDGHPSTRWALRNYLISKFKFAATEKKNKMEHGVRP